MSSRAVSKQQLELLLLEEENEDYVSAVYTLTQERSLTNYISANLTRRLKLVEKTLLPKCYEKT